MAVVIVVVIVAVVALALIVWGRRRRPDDGVASFQRQINALSRDARKPTIDQLRHTDPDGPEDSVGTDEPSGPATEREDGRDGT